VHHIALKPVLFGAWALRLSFPRSAQRPGCIAAVAGLGSRLNNGTGGSAMLRVLGFAMRGSRIIVQNPDDGRAITKLGIASADITLIPGSGVDTRQFAALPDPAGNPVKVALVSRMLRSKGVPETVSAIRRLRARGVAIELMLVGPADPENSDSLTEEELAAVASNPGVRWLGGVEDVPSIWRKAAIAVLPSTYGEGVPKALIEAASCARPIVTTDMPGCREIVRHGENGLLVPPGDIAALADAIAALAVDARRRAAMGRAGRELVERAFEEAAVADQTLALYQQLLRERGRAG